MSNLISGSNTITTLRSGDNIYIPNVDGTDQVISKTDFDNYIIAQSKGTWNQTDIAAGGSGSIAVGDSTLYQTFFIRYTLTRGSEERNGTFRIWIDGSTAKVGSDEYFGDEAGFDVGTAIISASQVFWKPTADNQDSNDTKLLYKVIDLVEYTT